MNVLKLKLRGAIGIKRGIGLEEVEIDFTQFRPGIVLFVGDNGRGKSTVIDNMHSFRRLASKDGPLASHFYLKDSYRILTFEYEGDVYESKILIDGITGASEAYLYKAGVPVNDGKLTTYDKAITNLLGSEELFFNSSFSAAEKKGIAGLKPAERRNLFYELLNLLSYEKYCDISKQTLKELEIRQSSLEGEIKSLQDQVERLNITPESLKEVVIEKTQKEKILDDCKRDLERVRYQIDDRKQQLAKAEEKLKQNEVFAADKAEKENQLSSAEFNKTIELSDLDTENESKLKQFEAGNQHTTETARIRQNMEAAQKEGVTQKNNINEKMKTANSEITSINADIVLCNDKLERIAKITANSETIKEKLTEREAIVKSINELMVEENRLVNEKSGIQEEEKKALSTLTSFKSELQNIKQQIEAKKTEIERLNKDVSAIDDVPCTEEVGSSCKFLITAHQSKTALPALIAEHKILSEQLLTVGQDVDLANKKVGEFTNKIVSIENELEEVSKKIKTGAGELAEIDKTNWLKLNDELSEAENSRTVLNSKKESLNAMLVEKNRALAEYETQIHNIEKQISDKLQEHEKQITNLNNLIQRDREIIELSFIEKKNTLEKNHKEKIDRLTQEIEQLNAKIDKQLVENMEELNKELNFYVLQQTDITEYEKTTDLAAKELATKTASMQQQLTQQQLNIDLIESKSGELQFVEREMKDYNFLISAFDKTGIPVLIMENLSVEITNGANDLLSLFDNKFRIAFETAKLTKDKKKMKEVFDINVVDADGLCELKMKSTGQKIWIETAIQLTVALMNKRKGKHIKTAWIDEKDGGLSEENAQNFMTMINEFYKKADVEKAYIITHRSSLQEMAEQKIIFKDGYLECIN
ncbi:MAG: SMC family ATPase [Melioribacteraceae bacterium]|nr:SMC family ATPase [Melioribacteraceae bacterium]